MKKFLLLLPFFVFSFPLFSQWTVKDPFEQKVFVENKGQYALKENPDNEILFGARQDGLHYFFTKNSIHIKYYARVERTEKEKEEIEKQLGEKENGKEAREESMIKYKWVDQFHEIKFVDAGLHTEIVAEQKIQTYYTFASANNKNIVANAYKKLVYKNLYPGIDMEFYFPEDKQGFKYNLIVQPGADPSQVKMQYPLSRKTNITSDGNVLVKSVFGDFVDHAPVASSADGKNISCSFKMSGGSQKFATGNYDKSQYLIIDPWTTTPVFAGDSNAYDIDWDQAGNVYVYGSTAPFQLMKLSPSGSQVWIYTTNFASGGGGNYYGDFAVDRISGSAYIVDGFNFSGAQAVKVNMNGGQVAITSGNSLFQEMWRIIYNHCTNQAVVGGGGTSNPSYTGCTFDTNLVTMNPVNVINTTTGLHDMWGVAIDVNGNCYFATAQTQVGTPGYDNLLFKVPYPALTPVAYFVATAYRFLENGSVNYAPGPPNGFNGMAMSDTTLYTYDSYVLKKWCTANGTVLNSLNVNGGSQITMTYGGITADDCGNIFIGLNSSIKQYDGNLTPVSTFTTAGMVYDVSLGFNNMLYICGQGFVSAVPVSVQSCPVSGCNFANGISSFGTSEISVYPNPATSEITISLPGVGKAEIALYNTVGQKLRSISVKETQTKISLEGLSEGIYIAEIISGDKRIVKKISKINP
jgi:hypothetical protein